MPKVKAKKRLILGVTGGIATGKTTVMELFAKAGVPTISSDQIAHDAILKGTPAYKAILRKYSRDILRDGGQICRIKLGKIVFRDKAQRKWLEGKIHPVVVRELKRFIRANRGSVIALDIPLLYEAGLEGLVNRVLVVDASKSLQIDRLRRRNGLSRSEALRRISAQMPLSVKRRRADIVVSNSTSKAALQTKIQKLLARV